MAKVSVILNCQIDNGKDKKLPGASVSMDEKEARKLADMGMVVFPEKEEKPAKPAGKTGKEAAPSGAENDDDLDPDALDQGGKGEGDEGE